MHSKFMTMVLLMGGIVASPALAEEIGNSQRGLEYAQRTCSGCHAILFEDTSSPIMEAPPFKMVADTPGITRTALSVFLQSPHPTMPNLMVAGEDADNLIAYILSLKGNGSRSPR
jgi:mono/diheme cytochrome c family protein